MTMIHSEQSELAGQSVTVKNLGEDGQPITMIVEDWWDRINGVPWGFSAGNPAAINYAIRGSKYNLPLNDEVLYGHSTESRLGYLFHVSEIV